MILNFTISLASTAGGLLSVEKRDNSPEPTISGRLGKGIGKGALKPIYKLLEAKDLVISFKNKKIKKKKYSQKWNNNCSEYLKHLKIDSDYKILTYEQKYICELKDMLNETLEIRYKNGVKCMMYKAGLDKAIKDYKKNKS